MDDSFREGVEASLGELSERVSVLNFRRDDSEKRLLGYSKSKEKIEKDLTLNKLATSVLQQLVDLVSKKNIEKIEDLVNMALRSIFYDMDLEFKINQTVKRNLNVYQITLCSGGVVGTISSYGGGVIAVVSMVLKVLFNLLSKRYPLLVFDESLSFLADKYIPNASKFFKELSGEFSLPILLVTHQTLFIQNAENTLSIDKREGRTVVCA